MVLVQLRNRRNYLGTSRWQIKKHATTTTAWTFCMCEAKYKMRRSIRATAPHSLGSSSMKRIATKSGLKNTHADTENKRLPKKVFSLEAKSPPHKFARRRTRSRPALAVLRKPYNRKSHCVRLHLLAGLYNLNQIFKITNLTARVAFHFQRENVRSPL